MNHDILPAVNWAGLSIPGPVPVWEIYLITTDHSEAFWEQAGFDAEHFVDSRPAYCVDHGGTPCESLDCVPLIVDGINVGSADGASLVDVAPTLPLVLGHPDAIETTGCSLEDGPPPDRVRFVEAARYGHEKKAVYLDEWKRLVSRRDDVSVGFSLPTEVPPAVERWLRDALPPWPDGERVDVRLSGLARDRLEDLGYV